MKFNDPETFNRKAARREKKPDDIIKALKLRSGDKVLDLGSGGGYFSFKFSKAVGKKGEVYSADTNSKFLDYINKESKEKGLKNIKTILIEGTRISLPEKVDLIFTRNVYHHLKNRIGYFKKLRSLLKPKGRIAIIDYKKRKILSLFRLMGHHTPVNTVINEMGEAGYRVVENLDFLPEQSFLIFEKN